MRQTMRIREKGNHASRQHQTNRLEQDSLNTSSRSEHQH
jgi:hypothetical protein